MAVVLGWKLVAGSMPDIRTRMCIAWDEARDEGIMFGGIDSGGVSALSDTWAWNPSARTWSEKSPATVPSSRHNYAMAYDQSRQVVVMFGGRKSDTGGPRTNETWEWDGTDWTLMSPTTSPSARQLSSMSYDETNGLIVLFGGRTGGAGGQLSETWTYDGSTWTQESPATVPGPRDSPMMSWHPPSGTVLMYGGFGRFVPNPPPAVTSTTTNYNDTWEWDGSNWTKIQDGFYSEVIAGDAPTPYEQRGPSPYDTYSFVGRHAGGSVIPYFNGAALIYGGFSYALTVAPFFLNDTWRFNGSTWEEMELCAEPTGAARHRFGMVYDGRTVMIFGGERESGGFTDETWVLASCSRPQIFRRQ